MTPPLRVLTAGLGNMGRSHALAYHRHPGFDIVGLVNRSKPRLHEELSGYDIRPEYLPALRELDRKHSLVFLPNHRSYLDPLVLRSALGSHGFTPNYVLGGGALESRIMMRLRQKEGWSYGAGTALEARTAAPTSPLRNRMGSPLSRSVATMPSGTFICSMVRAPVWSRTKRANASPRISPRPGNAQSVSALSSICAASWPSSRPLAPAA